MGNPEWLSNRHHFGRGRRPVGQRAVGGAASRYQRQGLAGPIGLAFDAGILYVAEYNGNVIRALK